jgi:hypothetical protein
MQTKRKYLIRVCKQYADVCANADAILRRIGNYRWVAYEKAGVVEGLLISEEPPVVPYPCEHSTKSYVFTCFGDETFIRRTELTGCLP